MREILLVNKSGYIYEKHIGLISSSVFAVIVPGPLAAHFLEVKVQILVKYIEVLLDTVALPLVCSSQGNLQPTFELRLFFTHCVKA